MILGGFTVEQKKVFLHIGLQLDTSSLDKEYKTPSIHSKDISTTLH